MHDLGRDPSAIVSFTLEGRDPRAFIAAANAAGVTSGASDAASTRIDAEKRGLNSVLRASPHYYNTEAEIDRLLEICA